MAMNFEIIDKFIINKEKRKSYVIHFKNGLILTGIPWYTYYEDPNATFMMKSHLGTWAYYYDDILFIKELQ